MESIRGDKGELRGLTEGAKAVVKRRRLLSCGRESRSAVLKETIKGDCIRGKTKNSLHIRRENIGTFCAGKLSSGDCTKAR